MEEFIVQNKIALLSLLVALMGGIPGILELIKFFKQKVTFGYSLLNFIAGNFPDGETMLLLTGSITNESKKPLIPMSFDLEIGTNNQWYKMEKILIPENVNFESKDFEININKPWENDLQKIKANITQSNPLYGFLMFRTAEIKKESLNNKNLTFRFKCTDIYNQQYHTQFEHIPASIDMSGGITYPKHGVTVKTKS